MNRLNINRVCAALGLVGAVVSAGTHAQTTLNVYGVGGPAPVMKEAATAFQKKTGIAVSVTAGPTPAWIEKPKRTPTSSIAVLKR
jgi:accessory colonization factor AcfC